MASIIENAIFTVTEEVAEHMVKTGLIVKCTSDHINVLDVDKPVYHISSEAPDWFGYTSIPGAIYSAIKAVESEPRPLPTAALLTLGHYGRQPGFLSFAQEAAEAGFGISQPGDRDLPEERWIEIATNRVNAICMAFKRYQEHSARLN